MKKILMIATTVALVAGLNGLTAMDSHAAAWSRCKTCHNFSDKNKIGPGLGKGPTAPGVFGRKAGTSPGFKYKFTKFITGNAWFWDDAHLRAWICDSFAAIKTFTGNPLARARLVHRGICTPALQDQIIAKLISISLINPTAVHDTMIVSAGGSAISPNVLLNDITSNGGQPVTVASVQTTSVHGGIISDNLNGTFTYTAPANFIGDDKFNYTISDGVGGSDTGFVFVRVGSGGWTVVGWSTPPGANAGWHDATDFFTTAPTSKKSNVITGSQTASMQFTSDFNAGAITFDYKVSSEPSFDKLNFYLDGVLQRSGWSGDTGWLAASFPVTTGAHTLKWSYAKDAFGSRLLDAAWVDNIIMPLVAPLTPDVVPPTVWVPANISKLTTNPAGIPATNLTFVPFLNKAIATDNRDGVITNVTNNAPTTFPIGTTTVTFMATDAAGNTGMASSTVKVSAQVVVAVTNDFNGDGKSDILFNQASTGRNFVMFMNGRKAVGQGFVRRFSKTWTIAGISDFNGDGKADILLHQASTGKNFMMLMNGRAVLSQGFIRKLAASWAVVGTGDYNGDGKADILLHQVSTGKSFMMLMNGRAVLSQGFVRKLAASWSVVGSGDYNGDGKADMLFHQASTGRNFMMLMNGRAVLSQGFVRKLAASWTVVGSGDYNGDGKADILFHQVSTGRNFMMLMNGRTELSRGFVRRLGTSWHIVKMQ